MQFTIEKIVPPMTGAGMQYFLKMLTLSFRKLPRKKTATAAASVCYKLSSIVIVFLLSMISCICYAYFASIA